MIAVQQIVTSAHFLTQLAVTANCGDGQQCETGLPNAAATGSQLEIALQIVIGTFAAVAVLVVLLAGLRFITSQGNPQETSKARDTIIYAGVGLIVAICAEAIVTAVMGRL